MALLREGQELQALVMRMFQQMQKCVIISRVLVFTIGISVAIIICVTWM